MKKLIIAALLLTSMVAHASSNRILSAQQLLNGSGLLSLPSATDTLVGRASTDTLTNKSISGSSNTFTNIPTSAIAGSALSGSNSGDVTIGTANGLSLSGQALSLQLASGSQAGALAAADYATFAAKQAAGNYITDLSGDVVATGPGAVSSTIQAGVVSNSKLANMAQSTIKGRAAGAGTGAPVDLSATQATAILNSFVGDSGSGGTKGLVPAPATGDATKFLRGDGSFASVPSATPSITDSRASPGSVTAVGGIAFSGSAYDNVAFIQGSGGAVTVTANPQIAAGTSVGQRLLLIGRSDTNTVTIADGTGLSLNGSAVLGADSQIGLVCDGTNWSESFRR